MHFIPAGQVHLSLVLIFAVVFPRVLRVLAHLNQQSMVNYYEEAVRDAEPLNGVPKCPSYDQAYDPGTRKCYRVDKNNEQGPCGEQMTFVTHPDHVGLGKCQCKLPDKPCGRPLRYWEAEKRCYEAFTKGPCGEDEWLLPGPNDTTVCNRNLCQMELQDEQITGDSTKEVFTFVKDGICYRTETEAFCGWNQVARFLPDQPEPSCFNADDDSICVERVEQDFSFSSTVSCPIGQIMDNYGECHYQ